MHKSIVILSGGMDSTTALYWCRKYQDKNPLTLSFDYGQRHLKELDFAHMTSHGLGLEHRVIDLGSIHDLIGTSALTNPDQDVPEGHYEHENMKQTVVPNRNMMMLSIAYAVAVSREADYIITGVHAGDHAVYPDCRPEFIAAFNVCAGVANEGFARPELTVFAPFINMSKTQIAALGDELGVQWEDTWSCYKGGDVHCGRCSTCVERLEALHEAGCEDKTVYEDKDYWREVTSGA